MFNLNRLDFLLEFYLSNHKVVKCINIKMYDEDGVHKICFKFI